MASRPTPSGTYTSIPMLIAEELKVEHAPPNEKLYGNPLLGGLQATGNSNAIRAAWQPLREAGDRAYSRFAPNLIHGDL